LFGVSFTDANTGTAVGGYGTILRTTNGGTTWTIQSSGTSNHLSGVSFTDVNNGTAVGTYGRILRTTNGGTTWTLQNSTGFDLTAVSFTDANNGTAVGQMGSILRTTNGGGLTFVNQISIGIPERFSIYQNYPNPFNPTTKIKFDVPQKPVGQTFLFVTLKVFDLMGREVQTLVNESLKPGTYEATFDGSALSSGVYFYKLVTDGFTETKKMLLVK
jgi:hypothetical protein